MITTTRTIPAEDIKPRDRIVLWDNAKVDSISHIEEFHVNIRLKGYDLPVRRSKVAMVTVVRQVP